ncbi:MAG: hypothetical protein JWM53_756 [bacterium]|nr:hypothetical protein [bacterium]
MRWRLALFALLAVGASAFAGVVGRAHGDQPNAACSVPPGLACTDDSFCVAYGAVCDLLTTQCVCINSDAGVDLGGVGMDLGSSDGGGGGGGTGGGGGSSGGTGPRVGGGMSGPPKSGCSFVPGSAT